LQDNRDGTSTFTVKASVKIFGITPAAWVSPNWDLKIMSGSVPGELPELGRGISSSVEDPSQDYSLGSKNVILKKTDIDEVEHKTKSVVAFGKVMYSDVFQNLRWTEFCWAFDWNAANTINSNLCPRHNGTDWSGHPEWLNTSMRQTIHITITNSQNPPPSPIIPPWM
jgi:hypothetical protein